QQLHEHLRIVENLVLQFGNALALQLPQRQQHATLERRGAVAAKIVAVAQVDRLDQQLELDLLASIDHIKAAPSSAARPGSARTGDPAQIGRASCREKR